MITSCIHQKGFKVGVYKNNRPSKIEQSFFLLNGTKSYTLGNILEIKNDSIFELTTCGNIMKGKWKTMDDSVFLYVESNKWRKDSLNKLKPGGSSPPVPSIPIGYKKIKNGLEQVEYTTNKRKTIDKLKLNAP